MRSPTVNPWFRQSFFVLVLVGCGSSSELPIGDPGQTAIGTGGHTGLTGATGGIGVSAGTGGTGVGTGGQSTGGFGATAAGGAIGSACQGVTALTAAQTLIADFECFGSANPDVSYFAINGWPHGGYSYYNDVPEPGITWTSPPVFEGGYGTPGHASSGAVYIRLTKPAENWGAGQGIWSGDLAGSCLDAAAFTGIRFWAKGVSVENSVGVSIGTIATSPPPYGSCALGATLCVPHATQITLTRNWTQYTVPWADLIPQGADFGPFNPREISGGINFHVNTWYEEETLEMWLDDVEFMGPSSEIPRVCLP
jgi:hypothetical protein